MKYRANSQDTWHDYNIKALDSMPVGTIVDFDGEASDIPTGWENAGNDYSTTEVNTGKTWIDGKPIYRKVISFSTSSTINSWDYIQHQIQNMDKPMPTCSMMVMYNGSWYYCPNDLVIEMYINTSNIAYYNNSTALADKPAFAVIEYTKTTD